MLLIPTLAEHRGWIPHSSGCVCTAWGASSKNNFLLFLGGGVGTASNLSLCSFYFPVQENKTVCPSGEVERKAAQLIGK